MDLRDLERARRSLYAPGASDEDVARYAALSGTEDAETANQDRAGTDRTGATAPTPPAPPAGHRSGPRRPAPPCRRAARSLVVVGAVALAIGALGTWSLQSSVPGPGTTPVAELSGAQQRPAAQPRVTSSSDVVISTVDPVLWSPGRRARTAATLRHVLTEAPSSAMNEPSVHQLLAPRFPHPGTDLSGFGAGAASAAISGMTNERTGTVVIACDRPCILSWRAEVVVVSTATAAGRWRTTTTTTTTQRTATGTAAAFVPLDAALPVPHGASSIDLHIRTQPDVRFLWALHLDSG